MGNRRLGRKRLYGIEKEGQAVDLGAGTGIRDAIVSTTQHRLGQELITEIVVDLGTSKATIIGGGGDTQAVGVSGKPAQLGRLTRAKVGIVTEIRAILTEVAVGGNTVLDMEMSAAIVNTGGSPGGALGDIHTLAAIGQDASYTTDADAAADDYLYITNGSGSSSAEMTAGKLIIYIYGFAVPDDLV